MPSNASAANPLQQFLFAPTDYTHQNRSLDPDFIETTYRLLQTLEQDAAADVRAAFEDEKRRCLERLLDLLGDTALLRMTAKRGDWLLLEHQGALILNGLVWLAQLYDGDFSPPANRAERLRRFCSRFDESLADAALAPADLYAASEALREIVLHTAAFLRSEFGAFDLGPEGMLGDFRRNADLVRWWPPFLAAETERQALVDRLAAACAKLPGHMGTLLTGSFADPGKRDAWGDVDLHSLYTSVPDAAARQALVDEIKPDSNDTFASFHFLGISDRLTADLCYCGRENQEHYLKGLDATGDAEAQSNFAHDSYAVSAYHLTHGTILDDSGPLRAYQERARVLPDAYRQRLKEKWAPVWQRNSDAFAQAEKDQDRLAALTAFNRCSEAALRLGLAAGGAYANPIDPQWLPREIEILHRQNPDATAGMAELPAAIADPLAARFRQIEKVWQRYGT